MVAVEFPTECGGCSPAGGSGDGGGGGGGSGGGGSGGGGSGGGVVGDGAWRDDFDGSELDRTSWSVETNCAGGGNGEVNLSLYKIFIHSKAFLH